MSNVFTCVIIINISYFHCNLQQNLLKEFPSLTEREFSPIKGIKAQLNLKADAKSVFLRSRLIPFQIKERVEAELDRMVQAGISKPVSGSRWAIPIVPVLKRYGNIRICGDFSVSVNSNIIVDEHPLPSHDELFAKMAECGYFSKIDLKQAYLQLELREEDKEVLTLNTCKGLFQCNRLMYGIASAPAIWQRAIENILKDIEEVTVFIDEMKVATRSKERHLQVLKMIFERLAKYNVRINVDKCEFLKDEISYCVYVIGKDGIRKEQVKMEAVQKLPRPSNVVELRAFLGLINCYGKFIENLSSIVKPLNTLLKKDTKFKWTNDCERAFMLAKEAFCGEQILVSFNPKLPVVVATDASPYGVGAVLSHKYPDGTERVIQYASATLNDTQKKIRSIG